MELVTRSSSLNSLWSIVYCLLVLAVHGFITYLGITKYRKLDNKELWGQETPTELRIYIALIVLSLLFLPLFIFFSLLKVGNTANDGTKLGRDHALDNSSNTLGARIKTDWLRRLWELFPPFSPIFHLLSAFLVLVPEVILTAAEVKYGIMASDAVWSCDLDFLFESERATTSNIISQSNVTVQANLSFYVVPTPKPPVGGWTRDTTLHVAFVYLIVALLVFSVRYAAVFWFTNKVFSAIFAFQLLFMTLEGMFSHCGFEILYKLAVNFDKYEENVHIVLGSGVIIFLYTLSGIILISSTFFIYTYGVSYFQQKFKIIDKRHNPDAYKKQTVIVRGSCSDYKTHTAAVVSLMVLGILKGPVLYDLVSLYRVTKDSLILTCVVIDVCYMVFWIILWTLLTLKQQWQFRILDYVPLNQPVFMISNDKMIKSASYHGGSIELNQPSTSRKRPSSLPSELTTSESGFGDVNSSEDERDRFELSLPPLAEVPGLENSRRKGSTHSLDRRSRSRRNNHQRVTFHETVKRSASTDSELCARNLERRRINVAASVHVPRPSSRQGYDDRRPLVPQNKPGSRYSIGEAGSVDKPVLNNALYNKQSASFSDLGTGSDYSDRPRSSNTSRATPDSSIDYNELTIKNDYACANRANLKLFNNETQTNSKVSNASALTLRPADLEPKNNSKTGSATSPTKDPYRTYMNGIHKGDKSVNNLNRNHLSPRTLDIIDNKHNAEGLSRRDSANYSLTSSQETASNDSDTTQQQQQHQTLCSQQKRVATPTSL